MRVYARSWVSGLYSQPEAGHVSPPPGSSCSAMNQTALAASLSPATMTSTPRLQIGQFTPRLFRARVTSASPPAALSSPGSLFRHHKPAARLDQPCCDKSRQARSEFSESPAPQIPAHFDLVSMVQQVPVSERGLAASQGQLVDRFPKPTGHRDGHSLRCTPAVASAHLEAVMRPLTWLWPPGVTEHRRPQRAQGPSPIEVPCELFAPGCQPDGSVPRGFRFGYCRQLTSSAQTSQALATAGGQARCGQTMTWAPQIALRSNASMSWTAWVIPAGFNVPPLWTALSVPTHHMRAPPDISGR